MLKKITELKHGVSINGELQVYPTTKYMEGDEVKHEVHGKPYSPFDVQNMGDFDVKSQEIVESCYTQENIDKMQVEIAQMNAKRKQVGLSEMVRHDRMIDDLDRISIRQATYLIEDGKVISKKYHRSWIMPGDSHENKDFMSRAIANKLHNTTSISKYQAKMVEQAQKEI